MVPALNSKSLLGDYNATNSTSKVHPNKIVTVLCYNVGHLWSTDVTTP